mmetsp:Transcript_7206/g.14198  ORF Transcript_7206/g.14198 Transcript_7206/m.14198 type:complete len:200 (-) Transcript_7206:783-1382(-)
MARPVVDQRPCVHRADHAAVLMASPVVRLPLLPHRILNIPCAPCVLCLKSPMIFLAIASTTMSGAPVKANICAPDHDIRISAMDASVASLLISPHPLGQPSSRSTIPALSTASNFSAESKRAKLPPLRRHKSSHWLKVCPRLNIPMQALPMPLPVPASHEMDLYPEPQPLTVVTVKISVANRMRSITRTRVEKPQARLR